MSTIHEVRDEKLKLELSFLNQIREFEKEHDVVVTDIRCDSQRTIGDSRPWTHYVGLRIEL